MSDGFVISWNYPIYIIETVDPYGPTVVGKDSDCCLIYRQLELAELYISQERESGGSECRPFRLDTDEQLIMVLDFLIQNRVTEAIFDATREPSALKVISLVDLKSSILAK